MELLDALNWRYAVKHAFKPKIRFASSDFFAGCVI
ncbi:MAG: hypothetical protein ACI93R_003982 [Flavobacteriales bacterium]|jgi:hypothetical protein